MSRIFTNQLAETGWTVAADVDLEKFFVEHKKEFPSYGGDTLRLAFYSKICYSEDVFDHDFANNKIIDTKILEKALEYLKEYRIKDDSGESFKHLSMYS